VILNWSISLYGAASIFWPLDVLVVIAGFWGLVVAIVSWLDLEDYPALARWENAFAWSNALLVVVLIGAWTYVQFHAAPGYTTDELSFDQYAAQLVAHGLHNPYVHSMKPAGPLFRLSPDGYTYTITGQPVNQLSYPSLSFLVYVPFILLGWTSEIGAGLNVAAWAVAVLLMFALLPRSMRAAALVFASIDVYLSFAAGGVTDMLYIPLLIVAAYRWDRFGSSRSTYIAPVAVGLAMAIKQTPWPVLVFVLCALAWDEYDSNGDARAAVRRAGRYFGVVLGVFLIPNLPYMIASPSAWFSGVLAVFVRNMVPTGQGLISLTLFTHLGGGSLEAYTVVLILAAVLLLAVFLGTYPLLRPATFMLPSLAYFFAARSQTNYLIPFIPVALVGRRMAGVVRDRRWRRGIAALGVLSVAAIIYAFSSTSPLTVTIVGERTTGFLGGIKTLIVKVHNGTSSPQVQAGPKAIAPGHTGRVELVARNYQAEPGLSDGFSVLAFTEHPAAVSVSHRFLLNLWRTATSPQAFDNSVPVGRRILLKVTVLDHFNSPVRRAGIRVYLTQARYTSTGFRRAFARINGRLQKTVSAMTNRQGTATFYIVGTKPDVVPTTLSSHLLNKQANYVYGGSGYINIRFEKR
jgi:uncharacterized membrane protein